MSSTSPDRLRQELAALAARHGISPEVVDTIAALALAAHADNAALEQALPDLGLLGQGGMAEVRRVEDPALRRTMALKRLRPEHRAEVGAVQRFIEEAQITAQLEHPGILPVHALGWHPDGDPYFTMKQVRGRTMQEVILGLHRASSPASWGEAPGGWSFRRVIDAFHRASQAIAFAHSRGVIHRDIKPQNMMVGDFGEVLVLDWGLAKILGGTDPSAGLDPISTPRTRGVLGETEQGEASGTPAYMSPEQARGDHPRLGPPSDVYALGAVLYEILSGGPPFRGPSPLAVLARVLTGRREPWPAGGPPLPAELCALTEAAMALDPAARPPDAREFAARLAAWLEGAQRRDRALKRLADAGLRREAYLVLRAEAEAKASAAAQILEPLPSWAPEAQKEPGWALEDEASALRAEAAREELAFVQGAAAALSEDPDQPEAHALLADHFRAEHTEAETHGDAEESVRLEGLLRAHDRGAHAAYLRGECSFSLITDPPGAEATLYRYPRRGRRRVAEPVGSLGPTPLRDVPLEHGSYLITLRAPGRAEVRYPICLGREERWDGASPGAPGPEAVPLPRAADLGVDEIVVPGGWFWSGDRAPQVASRLPRRRLWVDGFVIQRFPITHAEYLAFVNALWEAGDEDGALRCALREEVGGAMAYGRTADGHFCLKPDAHGDIWRPDWPVFLIDWGRARAYAAWRAVRDGLPWRLPAELEWEKAARGVDGRALPWGDGLEPTWACIRPARPGRPLPAPVNEFPTDESPYGVRGLAGGVTDWCLDAFLPGGPAVCGDRCDLEQTLRQAEGPAALRSVRGGAFAYSESGARVGMRMGASSTFLAYVTGCRLARSLGG